VEEEAYLTAARGSVDLLGAQDEMPCPRLQAQAVKKRLFEATFYASCEIVDQLNLVGLERTPKQAGKFALVLRFGQLFSGDANPCTTTRGLGEQIGCYAAVRAKCKPDELGACPMLTR
jgi:hypothetical protein